MNCKHGIILFGAVFIFSSCAVWREGVKKDSQHIEAVTCDPHFDAEQILLQQKVIPQKLLAFTTKALLQKDIQDKYFTRAGWAQNLRDSEWGLYASDGIDSSPVGIGHDWLVQLVLTSECQSPSHIVTLLGLEKDPRFQAWFKSLKPLGQGDLTNLEDFKKSCQPSKKVGFDGYTDVRCRKLVLQFLKETKVTIVQDHQVNKNFYVRNLACVESLRGAPEDIIQLLVDQEMWASSCPVEHLSEYIPYLLTQSLAEVLVVPTPGDLESLLQNISLIRQESVRLELAKMLRGYLQCEHSGKLKKFKKYVESLNLKLVGNESFQWNSEDCPGE